ncbi:MAG: hypothetical protein QXR53_04705 [Candidatus Norongarragalinales archaeon]
MHDFLAKVLLPCLTMSMEIPFSLVSHLTVTVVIDCGSWSKVMKYSTTDDLENVSRFCGVIMLQAPPCSTVGEGVGVGVAVEIAVAVAVPVGFVVVVAVAVGKGDGWPSSCFSFKQPAVAREKASAKNSNSFTL